MGERALGCLLLSIETAVLIVVWTMVSGSGMGCMKTLIPLFSSLSWFLWPYCLVVRVTELRLVTV